MAPVVNTSSTRTIRRPATCTRRASGTAKAAATLRRRPEAARFAEAWDAIMASPLPGPRPVYPRLEPMPDRVELVFRMGKPVGLLRRPDARRLGARLAALDKLAEKRGR